MASYITNAIQSFSKRIPDSIYSGVSSLASYTSSVAYETLSSIPLSILPSLGFYWGTTAVLGCLSYKVIKTPYLDNLIPRHLDNSIIKAKLSLTIAFLGFLSAAEGYDKLIQYKDHKIDSEKLLNNFPLIYLSYLINTLAFAYISGKFFAKILISNDIKSKILYSIISLTTGTLMALKAKCINDLNDCFQQSFDCLPGITFISNNISSSTIFNLDDSLSCAQKAQAAYDLCIANSN